jgi:hypothetical protein
MIDVALLGATGRMGVAILQAWRSAPDLRLVGALASSRSSWLGRDAGEVCGLGSFDVRVSDDPDVALESAAVAIDFSIAQASAQPRRLPEPQLRARARRDGARGHVRRAARRGGAAHCDRAIAEHESRRQRVLALAARGTRPR